MLDIERRCRRADFKRVLSQDMLPHEGIEDPATQNNRPFRQIESVHPKQQHNGLPSTDLQDNLHASNIHAITDSLTLGRTSPSEKTTDGVRDVAE
jgi:hypothetical protein